MKVWLFESDALGIIIFAGPFASIWHMHGWEKVE